MDAATVLRMEMAKVKIRSAPELAVRTGMKRSTAYARTKHPETMTLAELRAIVRATNMSNEQLIRLIREN